MAFISSTDVKVTLIPETQFGALPTTGNRYELPRKAGDSLLVKDGGEVVSDTIKPGRNANGSRRGNQSVSGSIELNAITAGVTDMLMESAVSGKYVANVLKAGTTDSSFTYIAELATDLFKVNTGCMATNFVLSAEAAGAVTYSFDIMGAKQDEAAAIAGTFTTTNVPDTAYEYIGSEVLNVTVAGATNLNFTSLSLNVEQARNARNTLSADYAKGLAASGVRNATLELTLYRETGVDYNALLNGTKQTVSFDVGTAGYGRKFTIYGQASTPSDVTEDDMMITVTITGAYNSTEGTALKIEKLP